MKTETMSEHDNGNGNITNNQNEAPTMSNNSTVPAGDNQNAVYAGGFNWWEYTGPEPTIKITAEHCVVTNAREVRLLDSQWGTCFDLHLGRKTTFQCLVFNDTFSTLEDGTLVTVEGRLHPFAWVEPGDIDAESPVLWVNFIDEEATPEEVKHRGAVPKVAVPSVAAAQEAW